MAFIGRHLGSGVETLLGHELMAKASERTATGQSGRLVLSALGELATLGEGWDEVPGSVALEVWGPAGHLLEAAHGSVEYLNNPYRVLPKPAARPLFSSPSAVGQRSLQEAIEDAVQIDAPAFSWAREIADYLPRGARIVTVDHRARGAPPPGSIWWPLEDGFAIVTTPELALMENDRMPSPKVDIAALERAEPGIYRRRIELHRPGPSRWTEPASIGGANVSLFAPPWRDMYPAPASEQLLRALGIELA